MAGDHVVYTKASAMKTMRRVWIVAWVNKNYRVRCAVHPRKKHRLLEQPYMIPLEYVSWRSLTYFADIVS